ncbi:hypothetical protein [Runella zeae]|uniref:hypothetical protein n=1 Tax=Runella zeae TaxID=94255 RepID=UPI000407F2ED|nr:hypothetical protein [Runella zeae]
MNRTVLLIIVLLASMGILYRFVPKVSLKQPLVPSIVTKPPYTPVAYLTATDSSAYWKAKYDSLYHLWTEARERIFTKKKYQPNNN